MRRLLEDTNRCLCPFKMAEYDDVQNEAAAFHIASEFPIFAVFQADNES